MQNAQNATPGEGLGEVRAMLELLGRKIDDLVHRVEGKTKAYQTVEEFAATAGRAPYTIRSWIKAGRIHAERVHGTGPRGRLLIPSCELQKIIANGLGADVPAIAAESGIAES